VVEHGKVPEKREPGEVQFPHRVGETLLAKSRPAVTPKNKAEELHVYE